MKSDFLSQCISLLNAIVHHADLSEGDSLNGVGAIGVGCEYVWAMDEQTVRDLVRTAVDEVASTSVRVLSSVLLVSMQKAICGERK